TKDPIGLYVAASGPRARQLTARLGAGWIATTADVASGAAALDEMRREWSGGGHDQDALDAVLLTGCGVLEEGEPADSPRSMAEAGYREIAVQIIRGQEHAIEDWGRIRRAFA